MNANFENLEQLQQHLRTRSLLKAGAGVFAKDNTPEASLEVSRLQMACGLTEFPSEIFEWSDSLEVLDLSGNALSELPERLPELHKLRVLFCSGNLFTELPGVLGQCKSLTMVGFRNNQIREVSGESLPPDLRWLILTGNQLQELPAELGHRPLLQKLMVAGNRLKTLPAELALCERLELVRIAANQFDHLPACLLGLPRLSWLSYSGNPFCVDRERAALQSTPVALIPWQSLQLEQKLGEGASGVISQATLLAEQSSKVAVKLFKGELTSDGLPASEMAACMQAGEHPHLIQVLGKLAGHPQAEAGLVMSLVDAGYKNLAGPPSFETCTRDVYKEDLKFGLTDLLKIAEGIASVAKQLHAKGLMHGDLYAHNILLGKDGHALLGDFGAACFKPVDDGGQALALERIEVRAFGCLLEELLERCEVSSVLKNASNTEEALLGGQANANSLPEQVLGQLSALRNACLNPVPAQRPGFEEIVQQLQIMSLSHTSV